MKISLLIKPPLSSQEEDLSRNYRLSAMPVRRNQKDFLKEVKTLRLQKIDLIDLYNFL
jgi:hypothetical protein